MRLLGEDDGGWAEAVERAEGGKGVGWDDLVIEAVSAHYNLDKAALTLPKKEKPAKEAPTAEQQAPAETTSEPRPAEERTKKKSKW